MSARSPNPGTGALEAGGRVDFAALRRARRDRVLAAMTDQGIDVLVLGREDNARYASGARRLWTAGTRPFGPGCLVVARTGSVYVLNTWDDGVPPEIPREHILGITWNPALMVEQLGRVEGLGEAEVVAVDASSPSMPRLFGAVAPGAEIVDGESLMRTARRTKLPAEISCIETACAIAESALAELVAHLSAGVTERALVGRFCEHITRYGVTAPASESAAVVLGNGAMRRRPVDRVLADGDPVALDPMVLFAGYEGGLARTAVVGAGLDDEREVLDRLIAAVAPGATAHDLRRARDGVQGPPLLRGLGMGYEPPVVTDRLGDDVVLAEGMVVSLQAHRNHGPRGRPTTCRDVVEVTADGSRVLSR